MNDAGPTVLPDHAIRFRLSIPDARTVRVAGDFTDWRARPLTMRKIDAGDDWIGETEPLAPGIYRYKFIVDGEWLHDPAHPLAEPDGHAGWNSIVGVGGPSVGDATDLRVLTLNLHTYQEVDPLFKLDQIAYVVAALDVDALALQEVGEHVTDARRPNAGQVLKQRLEELTRSEWHHQWRHAHPGFTYYLEGISMLARAPLEAFVEHRLSDGELARNALAATIALKDVRLRFICTHVTWPARGGVEETARLTTQIRAIDGQGLDAVLLAGDFNALADESHLQTLHDVGLIDAAVATTSARPTWPIDEVSSGDSPKDNLYRGRSVLPALSCRIDYQFFKPLSQRLQAVTTVPLFNGQSVSSVYQPIVSDHLGVLGVYRVAP